MGASPERPRSKWWSSIAHPGRRGNSKVAAWASGILSLGPARFLTSRRTSPASSTTSCKRGAAGAAGRGCAPSALS
eukprot:11377079-Alexandrium_andersonii.AAC.1